MGLIKEDGDEEIVSHNMKKNQPESIIDENFVGRLPAETKFRSGSHYYISEGSEGTNKKIEKFLIKVCCSRYPKDFLFQTN